MEMSASNLMWVVLVVACLVGYFVVSKVIDFFLKGSAWEPSSTSATDQEPPDDGLIGGHDPNKPIG